MGTTDMSRSRRLVVIETTLCILRTTVDSCKSGSMNCPEVRYHGNRTIGFAAAS